MVEAIFMMGGLGLVIGALLATASKVFYVYVDPLVERIDDALPGANCGGCGLPGCSSNAEAIALGKAGPDSCVAGGADLAAQIAEIMGVTVEAKEPDIARSGCKFGCETAEIKYIYEGLNDCRAAALQYQGMKECRIGCLGFGNCVKACNFGALSMGKDGLPVVDEILCTGCGACAKACPQNIITLTSITRRILHEYTTNDCTTPCQRACPAGIDIREYLRLIGAGDYIGAVEVIKERNPFPSIIGRICPAPCELDCRRQYVDSPVSINYLKRFAADFEREHGKSILPYKAPATDKKIAIVGGGIEGLSAAFYSARLGHTPTVFEAGGKLGGLLRSAISKERLPDKIIDWDIKGVMDMGVEVKTKTALGKDVFLDSLLKNDFDSVFIASGGWDARMGRGQGSVVEQTLPGVYLLLDLILSGIENTRGLNLKPQVVIAGGGKRTVEAVDICRVLGAEEITVMFRRKRRFMPVDETVFKELESLGVNIIFNAGITRIIGEDRELEELDYVNFETSEIQSIPVNTLVLASGRFPEFIFSKIVSDPEGQDLDAEVTQASDLSVKWEGTEANKKPLGGRETGLLAHGDVISGYSAAIKAIGAGRRAAASIHRTMYDIPLEFSDRIISDESVLQDVDELFDVDPSVKQIMPLNDRRDVLKTGEREKGFTEEMAKAGAARCLQCGLICYEKSRTPDGEIKDSMKD